MADTSPPPKPDALITVLAGVLATIMVGTATMLASSSVPPDVRPEVFRTLWRINTFTCWLPIAIAITAPREAVASPAVIGKRDLNRQGQQIARWTRERYRR